MKIDLTGQTALVTGGGRGIGRAIVDALKECGATVLCLDIAAPDDVATCGFEFVRADLSNRDELAALAKDLAARKIDVLVNNAGINAHAEVGALDMDAFDRVLAVNLRAPVVLCDALAPKMAERGYGRVVNVTSVFSHVTKARRAPYSTSKFALLGFTKTMALDMAPKGILVNSVGPGFIETEMTRRMLGEDGIREMTAQVPVGRLGRPEEVARLVAFLASPLNTFIAGQNVLLDGGFTST